MSRAACEGQWALFDSTEPRAHVMAAALCETCPVIDACRETLKKQATATLAAAGGGPVGTWAGQLIGARGRPQGIEHATERGFRQHEDRRELPCGRCHEAHDRFVAAVKATEKARVA